MIENRRSYNEFCGLAQALDVVGERWTLLLVRNLVLGQQRYSELLRGLPGITTNLLAKRLGELEETGLIERVSSGPGQAGHAYALTELGRMLEPAIHALGRFGFQYLQRTPRPDEHRSLEWLLVALRRRYRGGANLLAAVSADGVPYRFVLSGDRIEIARGPQPGADLQLRGSAPAFVQLFLHGSGDNVTVERGGDRMAEFMGAFTRGDPVLK